MVRNQMKKCSPSSYGQKQPTGALVGASAGYTPLGHILQSHVASSSPSQEQKLLENPEPSTTNITGKTHKPQSCSKTVYLWQNSQKSCLMRTKQSFKACMLRGRVFEILSWTIKYLILTATPKRWREFLKTLLGELCTFLPCWLAGWSPSWSSSTYPIHYQQAVKNSIFTLKKQP